MADTVLTELKIHEFDTVAQFLQHESEVGENDLVFTPDLSCRLPLLTPMWFDHVANDVSWLHAGTFSWHSDDKYKAVYKHLTNDVVYTMYAWSDGSYNFYTLTDTPAVGDDVYFVSKNYGTSKVLSVSNDTITFEHHRTGETTAATRNPSGDTNALAYGLNESSDTIGDITITYYLAQDGHKICLPDQESNIVALYEATGVAWYYILDTENKQFKLPRTKWGFTGLRDGVGNYVPESLPNIKGSADFAYGTLWGTTFSGSLYNDRGNYTTRAQGENGSSPQSIKIDASLSSSTYQDGAPVQQRATQMYLYFYIGHFEQDSVEQTAGLNAELFNNKADRDLGNIPTNYDYVVESQLPTEANGYTWYKKYKSGWVEQGGSPTGNSSTVYTGTLPVEMADTNYSLVVQFNVTSSGTGGYSAGWATKTTTGFTTRGYGAGSSTVNTPNWYVAGMAA